jgi:hypothetical protein
VAVCTRMARPTRLSSHGGAVHVGVATGDPSPGLTLPKKVGSQCSVDLLPVRALPQAIAQQVWTAGLARHGMHCCRRAGWPPSGHSPLLASLSSHRRLMNPPYGTCCGHARVSRMSPGHTFVGNDAERYGRGREGGAHSNPAKAGGVAGTDQKQGAPEVDQPLGSRHTGPNAETGTAQILARSCAMHLPPTHPSGTGAAGGCRRGLGTRTPHGLRIGGQSTGWSLRQGRQSEFND